MFKEPFLLADVPTSMDDKTSPYACKSSQNAPLSVSNTATIKPQEIFISGDTVGTCSFEPIYLVTIQDNGKIIFSEGVLKKIKSDGPYWAVRYFVQSFMSFCNYSIGGWVSFDVEGEEGIKLNFVDNQCIISDKVKKANRANPIIMDFLDKLEKLQCFSLVEWHEKFKE